VVVVAETLDGFKTGVGRTVLWNAAAEADFYAPSLGSLPAGQDPSYVETAAGMSFPAPEGAKARYVRVYSSGAEVAGSDNPAISQVVEIQAWGSGSVVRPSWQQGAGVIAPASVDGKSAPGLGPLNAVDGNPDTYWQPLPPSSNFSYSRHFDIQLDGTYDLSTIRIANSNRGVGSSASGNDVYGGGDYYHYQIYASQDGENFNKVAYKSDDAPATFEGDVHDVSGVEDAQGVSAVRVSVVYSSFQQAGRVYEVELRGSKLSSVAPVAPGVRVADFADTDWADEWERVAADPEYAEGKLVAEMGNLVERVLGAEWRDSFVFAVEDVDPRGASQDKDAFSVSGADGVITVKGRNGVSLASGLNHYLKNYAHVNYSPFFGSNLDMPAALPVPAGEIVKTTNYDIRNALNFCTWGYSMASWGWEEIEAFLDWAAMNGVNLVTDIVGQEEVIRRLFLEYGYSEAEIRDYITGPAYFPWYYMQNMTGFGGPLPDNWFDQRVETGRAMHDRMQTFGIDPIIQGYSGMVPTDFASKHTDAQVIAQGDWAHFDRPYMLRTVVASGKDYFEEMAPRFYEIQAEVFGRDVSHYYAVDPFHEGGNTGGMDMLQVYSRIQQLMTDWDRDAVWVLQQWQNNVTVAKLNGLDKDHVLVIDLNAVAAQSNGPMESTGTPWVYNMIHSFGGISGLHGRLDTISTVPPSRYQSANHMVGIGVVAEAFTNSGAVFDLLFDMTWEDAAVNVQDWIKTYADSRYGGTNANQESAWQILADTVLKYDPAGGWKYTVINQRPGFRNSDAGYLTSMEAALPKLIEAYREAVAAGGANEALTRDLAEVTIEMLQTEANTLMQRMRTAWNAKNQADWDRYAATFLEIVAAVEEIAGATASMRAGTWINDARDMLPEMDDWTKDLFEFNARALITTWGDQKQSGRLSHYANRLWSGVTADLYLERWKLWVEEIDIAFATGQSSAHSVDWFLTDWKWANLKSDEGHGYTSEAPGADLAALAEAACEQFCDPSAIAGPQEPAGAPKVLAAWDFTVDANDISGNSHHGAPGSGVRFTADGAAFDGTVSGQITVPWDAVLEPGAGESWTLQLDGIKPGQLTGTHQAIAQSRANNRYWVAYITPQGVFEFYSPAADGSPRTYSSGVTVTPGQTYNLTVTWADDWLTIKTTGSATRTAQYHAGVASWLQSGSQPIRFGAGADDGKQYFYNGSLLGASIAVASMTAPAVDKSDLSDLVAGASALAPGYYTSDSWSVLQLALSAAGAVLADDAADQGSVSDAAAALALALDGLDPAVSSSVAFKCAAGRVYLAVTVVNNELEEPVSLALSGPFG
ncbi:MAG: alpha-N-acetylglucosaminidase C-terminal domain-containing protein, partial [Bifidobacteriaceae bacterium]|nr:alpha-N-acetylglucosaminidase C-terminal domain-containing protein [Bifidobacteriaceae bacterium]